MAKRVRVGILTSTPFAAGGREEAIFLSPSDGIALRAVKRTAAELVAKVKAGQIHSPR